LKQPYILKVHYSIIIEQFVLKVHISTCIVYHENQIFYILIKAVVSNILPILAPL